MSGLFAHHLDSWGGGVSRAGPGASGSWLMTLFVLAAEISEIGGPWVLHGLCPVVRLA